MKSVLSLFSFLTIFFLVTGCRTSPIATKADASTVRDDVSPAGTDCYSQLTGPESLDSRTIRIGMDDPDVYPDEDEIAWAKQAVQIAYRKAGCQASDFVLREGDSIGCKKLIDSNSYSYSCAVLTNLGFFFVTSDWVSSTNVAFNRWD